MLSKISSNKFLLMAGLLLLAAFSRFIPHPPNFAPIAAMALFGGAYIKDKRIAFLLPIFAMFISDLVIGLHEGMWFVYLGFILIVSIGFMLQNRIKFRTVFAASLVSSILFFAVTNFGVWLMGLYYPTNLAGLAQSYLAAIPFFQNAIMGDLFYSGVLFGAYELVKQKAPALVTSEI
ncbi:MAG TPA: hypothetical protein PK559_14705 [Ignavibacteriaceae bacterium]|nr:hypothetical protein [Ignavibacteriaceae bacterium]